MIVKFTMNLGKESSTSLRQAAEIEGSTVRELLIERLTEVVDGIKEEFPPDEEDEEDSDD